jgi:hypothetical protein
MNKKLLISLSAGILAVLSACSGETIEALNNPIETSAALKVRVIDRTTNEPVEGATVTLLASKATTNANGIATIENVNVGSHIITIEKTDTHAKSKATVSVSGTASENIYVSSQGFQSVSIYPLTASLEGSLFYTNRDNQRVAVDGEKLVKLEVNVSELEQKTYYADVVNGVYKFPNLPPIGYGYSLTSVATELGGESYYSYQICNSCGYLQEETKTVVSSSTIGSGSRVAGNTQFYGMACTPAFGDSLAVNGTIECAFSDEIETTGKFGKNTVGASEVAKVTYNGNKVTIELLAGAEWQGPTVSLSGYVYSVKGEQASLGVSYPVKGKFKQNLSQVSVTGLARTHVTGGLLSDLTWDEVDDATSYYIYRKCGSALVYTSYTSVSVAEYQVGRDATDNCSYVVRAYNTVGGESLPSNAVTVEKQPTP